MTKNSKRPALGQSVKGFESSQPLAQQEVKMTEIKRQKMMKLQCIGTIFQEKAHT
jgi:hypothetical protein